MDIEGQDAKTYELRVEKLKKLRERGIDPFGSRFDGERVAVSVARSYADDKPEASARIAGRVSAIRMHGKSAFVDIQDLTGKIQVYLRLNEIGADDYEVVKMLDVGDIIGVEGKVGKTSTGEVTLFASGFRLLCKTLLPPPEKWHGLKDIELRYRRRYVDLFSNPEVRASFIRRTQIVKAVRHILDELGFIEVETPIMQPIAGGAEALPFVTHHNALDMDLYLRIAPELYLKRLLVGGFEKVYELSRNFRNEGISSRHSPEFTMLELYRAYGDYSDMMKIVEALFSQTAISVMGTTKITYQGVEYDLTPPYPRLSYTELFKESLGFDVWDEENVKKAYKAKGNVDKDYEHWHAVDKVFEWYCEEKLKGPVFIVDYPVEMSPLAKRKGTDERLVERFECFLAGMEVANAFTELNDPIEQRKRFEAQIARIREDGIPRVLDEDYIMALSYGMPPAGGLGVGIDRMVMFFTDTQTIRDVILFPLLRTKG